MMNADLDYDLNDFDREEEYVADNHEALYKATDIEPSAKRREVKG